jgi:hypothetical protein
MHTSFWIFFPVSTISINKVFDSDCRSIICISWSDDGCSYRPRPYRHGRKRPYAKKYDDLHGLVLRSYISVSYTEEYNDIYEKKRNVYSRLRAYTDSVFFDLEFVFSIMITIVFFCYDWFLLSWCLLLFFYRDDDRFFILFRFIR